MINHISPETKYSNSRGSKAFIVALGIVSTIATGCEQSNSEKETNAPVSLTTPSSQAISPEPSPTHTVTETTPTTPQGSPESSQACSFRSVEVGKYFHEGNQQDIGDQLAALSVLNNSESDIGFRETSDLTSFIHSSFNDPLFAEAAVNAVDRLDTSGELLTAEEFLSIEVTAPELCDSRHLVAGDAHQHLQRADSVSDYIIDKASNRLSENAQEVFERTVQEVQRKIEHEN